MKNIVSDICSTRIMQKISCCFCSQKCSEPLIVFWEFGTNDAIVHKMWDKINKQSFYFCCVSMLIVTSKCYIWKVFFYYSFWRNLFPLSLFHSTAQQLVLWWNYQILQKEVVRKPISEFDSFWFFENVSMFGVMIFYRFKIFFFLLNKISIEILTTIFGIV